MAAQPPINFALQRDIGSFGPTRLIRSTASPQWWSEPGYEGVNGIYQSISNNRRCVVRCTSLGLFSPLNAFMNDSERIQLVTHQRMQR